VRGEMQAIIIKFYYGSAAFTVNLYAEKGKYFAIKENAP